jgi:cyclopropane fatty-acyl-phospholipid synthase-like methyltransferase
MNQNTNITQKTLSRAFYEVMSDLSTSEDDPVVLGWRDRESQTKRFDVFVDHCVKSGDTVMDFGCGTADLYPYLKDKGVDVTYTGIEIMDSFIGKTKERFNDEIRILDTNVLFFMEKFDWVFASGVFSVGFTTEMLMEHIEHLVSISNKGICFNLLDKNNFKGDVQVSFESEDIVNKIDTLIPNLTIKIINNYSDDDFTVIITK